MIATLWKTFPKCRTLLGIAEHAWNRSELSVVVSFPPSRRIGFVKPISGMLAPICASCSVKGVRAFRAKGIKCLEGPIINRRTARELFLNPFGRHFGAFWRGFGGIWRG